MAAFAGKIHQSCLNHVSPTLTPRKGLSLDGEEACAFPLSGNGSWLSTNHPFTTLLPSPRGSPAQPQVSKAPSPRVYHLSGRLADSHTGASNL